MHKSKLAGPAILRGSRRLEVVFRTSHAVALGATLRLRVAYLSQNDDRLDIVQQ
jgi:hypothetical protein